MTPAVRNEAADAMFADPERPKLLLAAIRNDTVQSWTVPSARKRSLLMSRDAALREEARGLLEESPGEREQVLKRYEAALQMNGDPQKGRQVFERVCAKCHKLNGVGHDVGPDLATVRNRPPQLILPDIIMPNKSIAQGYESYVIETKSSGIVDGVLGPQSPTTITLRHEDGKEDVIRREDIQCDARVQSLGDARRSGKTGERAGNGGPAEIHQVGALTLGSIYVAGPLCGIENPPCVCGEDARLQGLAQPGESAVP